MSTLALIAKAPVAGRVKTRLCPPCTHDEAARVAAAAFADSIDVMRATECDRRVVVLDGPARPDVHGHLEVGRQRGEGLAARLAALFDDLGGPTLVIAMDTPQVTPSLLGAAIAQLDAGADAVLGRALDGGYWAIGLQLPDPRCFEGVPMHGPDTGDAQLRRLRARGLDVTLLAELRDVDTFTDAVAVAAAVPQSRFGREVAAIVRHRGADLREAG